MNIGTSSKESRARVYNRIDVFHTPDNKALMRFSYEDPTTRKYRFRGNKQDVLELQIDEVMPLLNLASVSADAARRLIEVAVIRAEKETGP